MRGYQGKTKRNKAIACLTEKSPYKTYDKDDVFEDIGEIASVINVPIVHEERPIEAKNCCVEASIRRERLQIVTVRSITTHPEKGRKAYEFAKRQPGKL